MTYLLLPIKALAADIGEPSLPASNITDIAGLSASVINQVLEIIGAIVVVVIIFGGIQYITAGPDTEKAALGRKTLTYAIIGLILIMASLAIVTFIQNNIR